MAAPGGLGKHKVLVTGATGLLGRAIFSELCKDESLDIVGTGFSRAAGAIRKLDLTDDEAVVKFLQDERPNVIIHSAAERRPDAYVLDEAKADALNVGSVWKIATVAREIGAWLILISTDYVFDGNSPPYKPYDPVSPVNKYGRSKARAEYACIAANPAASILRVPILFGPVKHNPSKTMEEMLAESAVTLLTAKVKDSSKPADMDAWAVRVPTFTADVAAALHGMVTAQKGKDTGEFGEGFSGYFHYSGGTVSSKFEMAQAIGKVLGVSTDHLVKKTTPPDDGVRRPRDCTMDCSRLELLLGTLPRTPFPEALEIALKSAMGGEKK